VFCRVGIDVQIMNGQYVAWEASAGCAEPAGEEDSKEFGNDDLAGHAEPAQLAGAGVILAVCSDPFDFSEHILEVVPPPPLS